MFNRCNEFFPDADLRRFYVCLVDGKPRVVGDRELVEKAAAAFVGRVEIIPVVEVRERA